MALLQSEKKRADEAEKKCAEAQEYSRERRKKLREAEEKVHQLQESLGRMIQCFSNQVSELKTILCMSPNLCSSTIPNGRDDKPTSYSFSFSPIPSRAISSLSPDTLRQMVQDLSPTKGPGATNWEGNREQAFDDFF